MAKKMLCAALAALLLMLAGCAPFTSQNVGDLLRAPALGQGQDEIQKALVNHLGGEEPQYKFPKEGSLLSPLVQADLDGNGVDEAILLYSVADSVTAAREKGSYVYVAVLEQVEGEWAVVQDEQGLSTDVASLQVTDLLGDGTRQLLVGYTTSTVNAKTLALYTYGEGHLQMLFNYDYSRYATADFTGRGGQDLVVVSGGDAASNMQLRYIPTAEGRFVTGAAPEIVGLDPNFVTCVNILPSATGANADYERLIVVDGINSIESGALASEFVYYKDGRFFTISDTNPLRGESSRFNSLLRSRDIDSDGVVEIPLRYGKNPIVTLNADKNLEYVDWMDFTAAVTEPVTKQFGILDSDNEFYVRLPETWRDSVSVVDGDAKGEWKVQDRRTMATLLSLRILEGGTPPVGSLSVPGTTGTYLQLAGSLPEGDRSVIEIVAMSAA